MTLAAGRHLGRYEIVAPLGAGGMGEVYKATDTRLHRTVALKVLGVHLAGKPELRQRFEREARTISSLNHPHICVLHDVGQDDGVDYLVMEYLEGQTLSARLAKGPLRLGHALQIAIQIADALDRAHRQSITHRDLKPSNIILTKSGAKLVDFGLAKLRATTFASVSDGAATVARSMSDTIDGMILGTLPYMSPEQLEGRDADARSDLFAFGCVLYEMVTGKRAFSGTTHASVIAAILEREPASIRSLDRSVPPLLDHIVQRCMAKHPDERWQTAADLKHDLLWLQRNEVEAPARTAERFDRFPTTKEGRTRLAVLSAVLLVVTIAAIWQYWPFRRAIEPIRSVAVVPFRNLDADPSAAYLSDTLTENIINGLSELPNLAVTSWPSVARYKGTEDPDLDKLRRELKVAAAVTGRVVAQRSDDITIVVELTDLGANRHLWGNQYRIKRDALPTVQDDIAKEITQSLRVTLDDAERSRFEASRLYLKGRYYFEKREGDDLKTAIALFNGALEKDPKNARVYAALANSYSLQSYYGGLPPKEAFAKAKVNAEKALELDETVSEAHTALGLVKRDFDQDWLSAEREFKRAIELDPNYATAHQWYGEYLTAMGRFDEAFAEMKLAQRLAPSSLIVNATLGWVLYNARRTDEAIEQIRRTIQMDDRFPVAHWFLGDVYLQKRMYKEGLNELETSVRLNPSSTRVQADRGYALAVAGRTTEAIEILNTLTHPSATAPYVSQYGIAVVEAGFGHVNEALTALERAYQDRPWDLVDLKVDPMLDRIRSDARFTDLVRRLRFPEGP
jgi:serine/threonine-protein kinase